MKTTIPNDFQQGFRCVALLIDGENISADFAEKIISSAGQHHQLTIKRVYGNVSVIPSWEKIPGIRMIHTGTGKNIGGYDAVNSGG